MKLDSKTLMLSASLFWFGLFLINLVNLFKCESLGSEVVYLWTIFCLIISGMYLYFGLKKENKK